MSAEGIKSLWFQNWPETPNKTPILIVQILNENEEKYVITDETGETLTLKPEFSVKDYTKGRLLKTFKHLDPTPERMNTFEHSPRECEYIEHKPTGAGEEEPDAQPPFTDLTKVDWWKYTPSPSELRRKYPGITPIFKEYGMKPIKIKENDLKYIKNAGELEIPFIADIPEPEMRLLKEIHKTDMERFRLAEKTNFKPTFKIVKEEDKTKLKIDRIMAGKYHPAYSKAQAKIQAKRKAKRIITISKEALNRGLISVRDNLNKLFWEESKLYDQFINGEITEEEFIERAEELKEKKEESITHHNEIYGISLTLTLPKEMSEEYMRLYIKDKSKYKKYTKAIDRAVKRTLLKIAMIQLQSEGLFIEDDGRNLKDKIVIAATGQKHITSSAFYGKEIDPLEETDYRNDNDPFSPHVHYHVTMLNAVLIKAPEPTLEKLGIPKEKITAKIGRNEITTQYYRPLYRISPYINVELAKRIWRDEVIKALRKAGFIELAKEMSKYEKFNIRAKYTKILKKEGDRIKVNMDYVTGAIEYAKRRPTEDIAKYFLFEDDYREIIEKYPEEWIKAVFEYPNRTYNWGLLKNAKRHGIEAQEDKQAEEIVEEYYREDEEVLRRGIPIEAVIGWMVRTYEKIIVRTRIGNKEELWLYVKQKERPKKKRPRLRAGRHKGRPT